MKIYNFQGDLTEISAETKPQLACVCNGILKSELGRCSAELGVARDTAIARNCFRWSRWYKLKGTWLLICGMHILRSRRKYQLWKKRYEVHLPHFPCFPLFSADMNYPPFLAIEHHGISESSRLSFQDCCKSNEQFKDFSLPFLLSDADIAIVESTMCGLLFICFSIQKQIHWHFQQTA